MENELENGLAIINEKANKIVIANNEDYIAASEFIKEVKAQQKVIIEHFADMKLQAHNAHKAICDKEAQYLKPLKAVETEIKNLMGKYLTEQEKLKLEAEKRLREEKEVLIKQLQDSGQAEIAQQIASSQDVTVKSEVDNIKGIGTQVDYQIVITDETKVPAYINGVEIRKIDVNAIKQLAKMSKGNIKIDGIEIKETKKISVRS